MPILSVKLYGLAMMEIRSIKWVSQYSDNLRVGVCKGRVCVCK